jgi:hypothetical protein
VVVLWWCSCTAGCVGPQQGLAVAGELGVSYAPARGGLLLLVAYRLERYDFDALTGDQPRLEQARSLVAAVGVHLGR